METCSFNNKITINDEMSRKRKFPLCNSSNSKMCHITNDIDLDETIPLFESSQDYTETPKFTSSHRVLNSFHINGNSPTNVAFNARPISISPIITSLNSINSSNTSTNAPIFNNCTFHFNY